MLRIAQTSNWNWMRFNVGFVSATLHYAALSVIVAAGVYLRLTGLRDQSLWFDEADVVVRAQRPFSDVLRTFVEAGENGPLYNLMLAIWVRLAGISEIAVRFPSAVAGVLALPAIYLLARRLTNATTALLATGLLAISPYHIWYSQEAKMYSIIVLIALLSTLLLVEALIRNTWPWWAGYTFVTTLMFYIHVATVLVFIGQTIYVIVMRKSWSGRERGWLVSATLLTVPYIPIAIWALQVVGGETPTWQPSVSLVEAFRIVGTKFAVNRSGPGIEFWGALLYAGLAGLGSGYLFVTDRTTRWAILLLALALTPVIGLYAVSIRNSVFSDRYIIVALPAFLILAASGIYRLIATRRLWPLGLVTMALFLMFAWVPIRDVNRADTAEKEDWRSAYADVANRAQPGDVLILHPGYIVSTYTYYVQRESRLEPYSIATITTFRAPWYTEELMVQALRDQSVNATRFWLIQSPDRVPAEDPDRKLERWLRTTGKVLYDHEVTGVRVTLFELPRQT